MLCRHYSRLILLFFASVCVMASVSAVAAPVAVGQLAPDIELPLLSPDQGVIGVKALRGKVVYLDFWASWCGPCRKSFPRLEQLRVELGPQGFEVLAVNVDEFEVDALAFLKEIPVSYLVVRDSEGITPQLYGIVGMPTGYLIDREGVVRLVHQGFKSSDADKLRIEITKLLED